MEVNTHNKFSGTTSGILKPSSSWDEILSSITELDANSLRNIFIETDFYSLFNDDEYCKNFHIGLLDYLHSLKRNDSLYEFVTRSLSLPLNMVLYADKFQLFRGVLDFGVSKSLGIHRFRYEDVHGVYSVDQSKLSGLSVLSFDLLLNFLYLYSPTISVFENNILVPRSGDTRFDVDITTPEESWYQYFNITSSSPNVSDGGDKIGKKPKKVSAVSQETATIGTESHGRGGSISERFHNVPVCLGEGYYVPIYQSKPYLGYTASLHYVLNNYETYSA
jgi:hypothetical protein